MGLGSGRSHKTTFSSFETDSIQAECVPPPRPPRFGERAQRGFGESPCVSDIETHGFTSGTISPQFQLTVNIATNTNSLSPFSFDVTAHCGWPIVKPLLTPFSPTVPKPDEQPPNGSEQATPVYIKIQDLASYFLTLRDLIL